MTTGQVIGGVKKEGVVSLDHIVKSYMNETGDVSISNYNRFKQIVVEGFTEMNLYQTTFIETLLATVNEINRVSLPGDYVDWVRISVEIMGEYWSLDENTNLIVADMDNCGDVAVYPEHENSPEIKGLQFSREARNIGEFNINKTEKVIGFKGNFKGKNVFVEYVSSGVNKSGRSWIPIELLTVLKRYLDRIIADIDSEVSGEEKVRKEYLFGLAMQQYENLKNSIRTDQSLAMVRSGLTQGIKR